MILGAGIFQLAGIRRAADLGCEVITVDYLPDNIGHRFSNESVDASTTDVDAVLDAARRMNIDGIVTFSSDVAARTAALVGHH
ncbi:MAG: carbamoyl-phosphate-synthetase, partial [Acidimicrobiia bacterium]|nr:carbamoyl-phosphate-synthetase [Acidimicrobiia bacterium]